MIVCRDRIVGPQSNFTGSLQSHLPRQLTCWAGGIMAVRWLERAVEKLVEESQAGKLA